MRFAFAQPALVALLALGVLDVSSDRDAERREWVLDHAVEIRSIDPSDGDWSDLEPLKAAIGDARVVQLGEQSHGDGATFLAKARLVRFLHEELGFDVLAFESGLFDCAEAEKELAKPGADAIAAAEQGVFAIWTRSEQCRPVFDYLLATHSTDRPLELAGFDCQFTALASARYVDSLTRDAKELGISLSDEERARLAALYAKVSGQAQAPPNGTGGFSADQDASAAAAAPFFEELERRFAPPRGPAVDLDAATIRRRVFLARTLRNFRIFSKVSEGFAAGNQDEAKQQEASNLRDIAMGENLVWLANEWFPDRKILVWAASRHIAHDLPKVRFADGRNAYAKYVTMGDVVHRELGDAAYTILFTAARGRCSTAFDKLGSKVDEPAKGSLEEHFDQVAPPLAFLDLRATRADADSPLKGDLDARPFGYARCIGDWTQLADAFVFTAEMTPSTPRTELGPRR